MRKEADEVDEKRAQAAEPVSRGRFAGWIGLCVLLLVSLILNLAGNDRTGLWDRDEPRYVGAVHEMRARGDWITPYFNGEPRYHKPILIYWLMGASTAILGETPFASRLISALAGVGVVGLTWRLGRRMIGPHAGLLAALFTATTPLVVAQAKLATTDALLVLEVLAATSCLWELSKAPSRGLALAFWALVALAILTKGPVGPALIAATAVAARLLGWRGNLAARLEWRRGLIVLAAIAAPWLVLVSIVSLGAFPRFALGHQLWGHMTSEMERHGGFPGYYLLGALVLFGPWSALVPAAVVAAWPLRMLHGGLPFLIGWVLGPLVLLELFGTKLIHYYLPSYPAWSILAAWLVLRLERPACSIRSLRFGRLALGIWLGTGAGAGIALVAGTWFVPAAARLPMLCCAILVAAGLCAGARLFERGIPRRAVGVVTAAWGLVLLIAGAWLIPALEPLRTSREVGERLRRLAAETGYSPVLLDYQPSGVVYAYGAPIAVAHDRAEFFQHLEHAPAVLTAVDPESIPRLEKKYDLVMKPLERVVGPPAGLFARETLDLVVVARAHPGGEAFEQAESSHDRVIK